MVLERIRIIFEGINKVTAPARAATSGLKQLEMQTQAYHNVAANANISLRESKQFFRENNLVMQDANTAISTLTGRTQTLGTVTEGAGRAARRFNFSWLSVMFAGMALNRVFGGMVKSQLQLLGITDLFGATLTLVLLPVMMALLPFFLWLSDVFMNLSPEMKIVIGTFILLGAVIGILMLFLGQFILAVMGIAGVFGVSMGAAAVAMLGVIIIIVAIGFIIAGIIIIIKNWGKNWIAVAKGIIIALAGVALAIIGIMVIFFGLGILAALVWIAIVVGVVWLAFKIIKHWDIIRDALIVTWAHIKNTFLSGWNFIVNLFERNINRIIAMINKIPGISVEPVNVSRFKTQLEDIEALRERLKKQREAEAKAREVAKAAKAEEPKKGFIGPLIPEQFKGYLPGGATSANKQNININNTNTFNVSDKEEMEKMINDNNSKLVEDIKRQIEP